MILRGINFGPVLDASGVRNFFGDGYWYHKVPWPVGPRFKGSTFVAKTTTYNFKRGNMPLVPGKTTPREWKPRCIRVYFRKGMVLNAVGLSGPGAKVLLETGKWQEREDPFFLSFMSTGDTPTDRLGDLTKFVIILKKHLPAFKAKKQLGLQINFSCPNVGIDPMHLVDEVMEALNVADDLDIPLMPKFNVMADPKAIVRISRHGACDAICMSNSIPWNALTDKEKMELFGTTTSPLADVDPNGGGLSGAPLLPRVEKWILDAIRAGLRTPINAGGGILGPRDAIRLFNAGAASVALGSIAMLRPWRVQRTINHAHQFRKEHPHHVPTVSHRAHQPC
jgi:dihydroorotate dehydrogenase